jgi:energy-coupling factor transport system permease protein
MSLAEPLRIGPLTRVNPVAKLAAVLVLSATLILTVDWVSASVALVLEVFLFGLTRLPFRAAALRAVPLVIAAVLAGFTTVLYGQPSGRTYWEFWSIHVTDGSIALAVATTLRILAIGIPAVVLFLTIDPTDLADGLAQIVRLPSRFVIGGLAALRLMGLLTEDWRAIELARRARGVADRGRLRRIVGQVFALLVLSIRRASKLATAMEARGFGAPGPRTWARPSRFGRIDWFVIALGGTVAAVAVAISVATGSWHFVAS